MKNVILIKNPKNWGLDRNEVLKKAVEALDHFKLKENGLELRFSGGGQAIPDATLLETENYQFQVYYIRFC